LKRQWGGKKKIRHGFGNGLARRGAKKLKGSMYRTSRAQRLVIFSKRSEHNKKGGVRYQFGRDLKKLVVDARPSETIDTHEKTKLRKKGGGESLGKKELS